MNFKIDERDPTEKGSEDNNKSEGGGEKISSLLRNFYNDEFVCYNKKLCDEN